jgi:asparagine synthase (glutamine-hydrolysing)
MSRALWHRGPDDEGFYLAESVGLASRRLSILDLSRAGHMPLFNEAGTVAVVQNGEIYNYRDLREQLVRKGHKFKSSGDTEVIVHLYEEVGESFVEQLEGMFAFALWDLSKKKLVLARDRFGEKPLYCFESPDGIAFASELRSLCHFPGFTRELDWAALDQFLTLGYILSPKSPFLNTSKLLPGHFLVFEQDSCKMRRRRYWSPPVVEEPEKQRSEADYIAEFEELFGRIVESRLASDVPVGAFLSGGIDSSLVVAAIEDIRKSPLKTFSIGYGDSFSHDENPVAEQVAKSLGVEHQSLRVEFSDFKELLTLWPDLADEPMADPAYFGVYLISKFAKKSGVTVMVSGDGGDELFSGYPIFQWVKTMSRAFASTEWQRSIGSASLGIGSRITGNSRWEKAQRALQQPGLLEASYYLMGHGSWSVEELATLKKSPDLRIDYGVFASAFGSENSGRSLQDQIYRALLLTYLPDNNLARMDRSSMANSIETRTPFLHPHLADFAAKLPMSMKCRGPVFKYILRKALAKRVSEEIWRRPKSGFNALPMTQWLKSEMNFLTNEYLSPDSLKNQGIYDDQVVAKLREQHGQGGRFNHWRKLWLLLVLQMWLQRWGKYTVAPARSTVDRFAAHAFEGPA